MHMPRCICQTGERNSPDLCQLLYQRDEILWSVRDKFSGRISDSPRESLGVGTLASQHDPPIAIGNVVSIDPRARRQIIPSVPHSNGPSALITSGETLLDRFDIGQPQFHPLLLPSLKGRSHSDNTHTRRVIAEKVTTGERV